MEQNSVEGKIFTGKDFVKNSLPKGEYERCTFTECMFADGDLSTIRFIECEFQRCDMSNINLKGTGVREINFIDCKLVGAHFEQCDKLLSSLHFENCILNLSSFFRVNIKKTMFKNCSLQEADFTESDLTGAVFDRCDLARAVFKNTVLEKTDFRTAYNYSIDPEINRIKKAKFTLNGIAGLLDKYDVLIE